ncbi:MAG: hypothetical protein GIW94_00190 [Candidatus Eremiobacteraeota bacterium]|nr:hypothetical protein [Candidatus Eremiobacteraeota bacterium]MBC5821535.1 hypothetical protein [Candidatus Eremiobacteraeota bacterium]
MLAVALVGAASPSPGPAPSPTACTTTVFPMLGTRDARSVRRGPGLLLSGAGLLNVPVSAMQWLRNHLGGLSGRAGNVVVLSASGGREDEDGLYRDATFASVQEILIPPCTDAAAVDALVPYVNGADAVLFAGGDQANYARWKGSALIRAVQAVYARGGFVGGGSAGLAIQGALDYDSVAADRLHPGDDDYAVTTQNALHDPLEPEISFTSLFAWPALADTITDTHFVVRNRFGRLVAFLARIVDDKLGPTPYYGLGVDEGSVVLVDSAGMATVRTKPNSRGAYLVRLDGPVAIQRGQPLRTTVDVAHIGRDGERFDLLHKRPGVAWTRVQVDGARPPFYRPDPYSL